MVLAWERELHPDMARVNVNGGAIAVGHPLDHPPPRAGAHGETLLAPDHVHRLWPGHRDDHRAVVTRGLLQVREVREDGPGAKGVLRPSDEEGRLKILVSAVQSRPCPPVFSVVSPPGIFSRALFVPILCLRRAHSSLFGGLRVTMLQW